MTEVPYAGISKLHKEFAIWKTHLRETILEYANNAEDNDKDRARKVWSELINFVAVAGISDDELHVELGASLRTILRWRNGEGMPPYSTRQALALALAEILQEKETTKNSHSNDNDL